MTLKDILICMDCDELISINKHGLPEIHGTADDIYDRHYELMRSEVSHITSVLVYGKCYIRITLE